MEPAKQQDMLSSAYCELASSDYGHDSSPRCDDKGSDIKGDEQMDKSLVERILKDGKIDRVEMKVLSGYVCDSSQLSKEDKLLLKEIFTKINSGEVRLET